MGGGGGVPQEQNLMQTNDDNQCHKRFVFKQSMARKHPPEAK